MCEHCTPLTTENFSSQKDFKTFEKVLETKCVDGTFVRVVNADETENRLFEDNYQCTFCGTDWVLSIDENSWRGYFLPVEGITMREPIETNSRFETFQGKRSKNCGCCLGMIFLFIALILYLIYEFSSFVIDLIV